MDDSAQNLTERAVGGDGEALGALWVEHRGWLAAVVLAAGADPGELDDLLQEVAVAVSREISTLRSPEAVRPWLRAIARNVTSSAARRRGRERTGLAAARANGTTRLAGRERETHALSEMMRLIAGLPEEYREPLLLRATRAMPVPVIAETLGLSVPAVETRLRRARAMLRECRAVELKEITP